MWYVIDEDGNCYGEFDNLREAEWNCSRLNWEFEYEPKHFEVVSHEEYIQD
jgi:hypothetical protein